MNLDTRHNAGKSGIAWSPLSNVRQSRATRPRRASAHQQPGVQSPQVISLLGKFTGVHGLPRPARAHGSLSPANTNTLNHATFDKITLPTPTQQRAFELINSPIPLILKQTDHNQPQPRNLSSTGECVVGRVSRGGLSGSPQ
jgi:hypothetical protein